VFEPDDAWQSTGDLFRRDEHGELWLVDQVSSLVRTAEGLAIPAVARRAMEAIPAVDLAVAYGVPEGSEESAGQVLVTSVTLRPGTELTAAELDRACDGLAAVHRPRYVQVVPNIPVTAWCRPMWSTLRKAGVPKPTRARTVFHLTEDAQHYRPLA
jgi:putative long chain acyl-CoA synthase